MVIAGAAFFVSVCAFFLYVLVRFYQEAVRPPRSQHRLARNVIVLRRRTASAQSRVAVLGVAGSHGVPSDFLEKDDVPEIALPTGLRRLATKRTARS